MDKYKVILDTDIGDDVDDAYALALLLRSPEIELDSVIINTGDVAAKAAIARKMLDLAGCTDIPVFKGHPGRDPRKVKEQADWAKDYSSKGQVGEDGVVEMVRRVDSAPGEIVVIAIGPLTNIGAALDLDPDFGKKAKQIIIMGGSLVHGYELGTPSPEYNIVEDVAASQKLFNVGANLVVVPLDATGKLQITARQMAQLAAAQDPLCDALVDLSVLCEFEYPTMHDPRACAVLMHKDLALSVEANIEVTDNGFTKLVVGPPNCKVVIDPQRELLLNLMWRRFLSIPKTA